MTHIYTTTGKVAGWRDVVCPACGASVRLECVYYEYSDPELIAYGECVHVPRLNTRWGKLAIKLRRQLGREPKWNLVG